MYDSLVALEFTKQLGNGLDLPFALPATLIFDYPTVEAVADYLADKAFPRPVEPSGAPLDRGAAKEAQRPQHENRVSAEELENLSNKEVEDLLLKETEKLVTEESK